jgi:hypothetical protein
MREDRIIVNFEKLEHDVVALRDLCLSARTRIDAIERCLFHSRIGFIKWAVLQLISPGLMSKTIAIIHKEELDRFNKQIEMLREQKRTGILVPINGKN